MEEIGSIGNKSKCNTVFTDEDHVLSNKGVLISTVQHNGHRVYQTGRKSAKRKQFSFVNANTKKVDVQIDAADSNDVMSRVLMKANEGNTIKTAEALRHLIVNHNKVVDFSVVTPGGLGVLRRLGECQDVDSCGFDFNTNECLNINMSDDEYVSSSVEDGNSEDQVQARKLHVVFYKK